MTNYWILVGYNCPVVVHIPRRMDIVSLFCQGYHLQPVVVACCVILTQGIVL